MREPAFWWRGAGLPAALLSPVAGVYGAVAGRRLAARGWRAAVPVICIGNPTVGGAGKTPLALAVVRLLQAAGEQPVLLSRGYGGHLAGPVRVDAALHDATAVAAEARSRKIPVLQARLMPDAGFIAAFGGGRALAFAGIGDPEKFFATLRDAGVALAATRPFSDHHRYTPAEAQSLCDHADREGLVLVTTEKDAARMQGDAALMELSSRAHALPVSLAFDDEGLFRRLLLERVAAARKSRA
jgi:tetraacyldisaccharide 4'-kinase